MSDALDRQPISDGMKAQIDAAFRLVPDGKKGALVVLVDDTGARAHIAAKLGERWKVAAGGGRSWSGELHGEVAIVGTW